MSSLPLLPISAPPTSLNECFFNSLIVGVPWSLIFWHFWLFIVFKLVFIFLLVVWGSKAFLPMPPSRPYLPNLIVFKKTSNFCLFNVSPYYLFSICLFFFYVPFSFLPCFFWIKLFFEFLLFLPLLTCYSFFFYYFIVTLDILILFLVYESQILLSIPLKC